MTVRHLRSHAVERVWGRTKLPAWTGVSGDNDRPVGEIWFEDDPPTDSELLIKYIFTSERLSIQVHPDNSFARALGLPRGKSEAWLILDAEPGTTIAMGFTRPLSEAAVRAAIADDGLTELLDWRPVRAGQLLHAPAGTVHAIGGGISLLEIQQNLDLTYRLYDYGRPRELHVDAGLAAAALAPAPAWRAPAEFARGRQLLCACDAFTVERWTGDAPLHVAAASELILIPLADGAAIDDRPLERGSAWRVDGAAILDPGSGTEVIATYPGAPRIDLATGPA